MLVWRCQILRFAQDDASRDAPTNIEGGMNRLKRPEYLPTRRQIVEECAEIRRNWTNSERRRRSVGHGMASYDDAWMPPQILTSQCLARVRKIVAEAV